MMLKFELSINFYKWNPYKRL